MSWTVKYNLHFCIISDAPVTLKDMSSNWYLSEELNKNKTKKPNHVKVNILPHLNETVSEKKKSEFMFLSS